MTDEQPSKRPRALLDKSRLSPADQLAFARVAQLLNKPLSELYEEASENNIATENTREDILIAESNYVNTQTWTASSNQFNTSGEWQQTAGSFQDYPTIQRNAPWTQSTEAVFVDQNLDDITFGRWAENMSQKSPLQVGNIDEIGYFESIQVGTSCQSSGWSHEPTADEPWLSIPTSYLAKDSAMVDLTGSVDLGTDLESAGNDRYRKVSLSSSKEDRSVSNARSPRDQHSRDHSLNCGAISSPIESDVDQDWIVLSPEISSFDKQRPSSPKVSTSNRSTSNLSITHNTLTLDNPGSKSSKWVVSDSSAKVLVPRRHGPFQDQHLREETSNTRKLKACVRCRFQKIRCHIDSNNPSGSCQTCQDVSKQKIHTLPCVRYKLTECTLYRTGKAPGLEFTFRWPVMKLKDISEWSDTEIRTIKVISDVCPVPLELSVRRFVPISQDSVQKSWMDGKVKKVKPTTPFAIANMSATVKTMREYIDRHVFQCMEFWLTGRDPLIQETYKFARQYMLVAPREEAYLLAEFFRLWFAVRRTATTEFIDGEDTLDMQPETSDRSYPLFGKVPLPPVMIQQLDIILTLGLLQPLRKKFLEDFQKIVLNNKSKSWMTIYLVTFICLHGAATVTAENYQNARKHGLKRRFAMPDFISDRHHSANVFLTHYHYGTKPCNPFNIDWRKRQTTPFSEMTTNEIDFLLKTSEMVEERKNKFRRTLDNNLYEDDFYFVSQLFDEEWEPMDTVIDYGDDTIFGVPLKQSGSPKRNEDV